MNKLIQTSQPKTKEIRKPAQTIEQKESQLVGGWGE